MKSQKFTSKQFIVARALLFKIKFEQQCQTSKQFIVARALLFKNKFKQHTSNTLAKEKEIRGKRPETI